VLRAHFGHIFAHILHAGWRAGHHGVNFRNSDLVEVRVHSQRQYLTDFGRWICPLIRSFYVKLCLASFSFSAKCFSIFEGRQTANGKKAKANNWEVALL
jgi:hypothetical protein